MEQKQQLLREQILQRGIQPTKFYEYWESLGLGTDLYYVSTDFETVEFDELKIIVETYISTYNQYREGSHQADQDGEDDEEFDDFQGSTETQAKQHAVNTETEQKPRVDAYAGFNWDLLMTRPTENTKPSPVKKQVKKLSKPGETVKAAKTQNKDTVQISKKAKKTPQRSVEKSIDLMEDFDLTVADNKKTNKSQSKSQLQQSQLQQQEISPETQPEKSVTITFKEIESESKRQKVNCLKLKENILEHHKNVEITIPKYVEELQEDGQSIINKLWKGNEYCYTIKTIGRNKNRSIGVSWEVKRKYVDFQWLRNTLLKFYPGVVVPPLPPYPKSKEKVQGQKKKLENFMMDAYRCPELRNSRYFESFLSYGNFSDFEGLKKTTESAPKPQDLGNILNMTGEVDMLHGSSIQVFTTGIQQYLNKSSQHLKTVKGILAEIGTHYDSISGCYTRLADIFELMSKQSCEFSEEKCFPKLTETYKQIGSLINKHSRFCEEEKLNIETFLVSHFSYEKDRIDNMQTLIAKKQQFTAELGKRQPKQESGGVFGKLTGLFGEKVESMEIPSSKYESLYRQVGFYNSQLLNEMIRCVEVMIESQIDHFSGYGISRIDCVDTLQKTWSEIMVELSKLNMK